MDSPKNKMGVLLTMKFHFLEIWEVFRTLQVKRKKKAENYEFKKYKFLKACIKVKNYKLKKYIFESIYKNGKNYKLWRYWNSQTNISST